ncbi:Protein CBG02083 [Caenorhabditis briggsae]|uniref:Protein CBG02083 n=1 Tax=Caenorhabditis briggsae TaxID=6238 RepID=A8WRY4_CAEBR|nr:Protein CBG02083 [Caenorhabditis briggsae]CAP23242.1 Protein CBG02083 [Caenorhabditis briggsae]
MLIPVCNERLPVRLEICVLSAKSLPVMNKSINSTDAFVEVRFLETVDKTEVITSLNPVWNSEQVVFDTDEKELTEEWLQLRVMDHDTYSANDAIGRVNIDCNIFLERMRLTKTDQLEETITMRVYDTIYGNRGELTVAIKMHLLMQYHPKNYVHIMSANTVPTNFKISDVYGLVDHIRCEKDPDYEWLDKIRTPRATNEARQSAIRVTMRDAIMGLALKAYKMGGNAIIGLLESVDMEGSASDLLTCRLIGTCIKVVHDNFQPPPYGRPIKPILTIDKLPMERQIGLGSLLTARSLQLLNENEDPEAIRRSYWVALRAEIFQQARSIGCNLIVGYTESVIVNEGVALLTCTGTAVVQSDGSEAIGGNESSARNSPVVVRDSCEKEIKEKKALFKFNGSEGREKRSDSAPRAFRCNQFHAPTHETKYMTPLKSLPCAYCKGGLVSEFVLSTQQCPPPQYYAGPRNFIQVSVCKKIASDPNETQDYAADIGNALPYSDHELIGNLLTEAKSVYPLGNAIFSLDITNAICDDSLVCIITGVLVRLLVIQVCKTEAASPSITNVLSFSSLQRQHDARRFSWGTVRDAIRFKPTVQSNLTLKILNINPTETAQGICVACGFRAAYESLDWHTRESKRRQRYIGINTRKSKEKTKIEHFQIAGVHLSNSLYPIFVNKDVIDGMLPVARFSDVFVREDLTTAVRDSTTVDGFVTNALEERITTIKSILSLGGSNAVVANMKISCPQFNVSKEHAHIILLVSVDFYNMP